MVDHSAVFISGGFLLGYFCGNNLGGVQNPLYHFPDTRFDHICPKASTAP
jgi:hypothetical protein